MSFKCIVPTCRRYAAESHAICQIHLLVEISATVLIGFALVGCFLYVISWLANL